MFDVDALIEPARWLLFACVLGALLAALALRVQIDARRATRSERADTAAMQRSLIKLGYLPPEYPAAGVAGERFEGALREYTRDLWHANDPLAAAVADELEIVRVCVHLSTLDRLDGLKCSTCDR